MNLLHPHNPSEIIIAYPSDQSDSSGSARICTSSSCDPHSACRVRGENDFETTLSLDTQASYDDRGRVVLRSWEPLPDVNGCVGAYGYRAP